jgi:hypothetical protein
MDQEIRFCKDCLWFWENKRLVQRHGKCIHPFSRKDDPDYFVTGVSTEDTYHFAFTMRGVSSCGPEAVLWERKLEQEHHGFFMRFFRKIIDLF